MINKDLGLVTAYAYAVSKGYTGTEDEFAELMASYASVAEQAEESAEDSEAWAIGKRGGQDVPSTDATYHNNSKYYADQAGTSASTAASSASAASASESNAAASASSAAGSASSATTSAATATEKAGEASTSATAAGTSATNAAGSATNAASSATAASASATAAGNAQTAAETAQGKAEDAQEAAETAAQSVSQSAAQISQNASDISDLKSALFNSNDRLNGSIYLYNGYKQKDGTGYYNDDGTITSNASWQYCSDFIPVMPDTVYSPWHITTYIDVARAIVVWYTLEKKIISRVSSYLPVTSPANAYYCKLSFNSTSDYVMFVDGSTRPESYRPFGYEYRTPELISVQNNIKNVADGDLPINNSIYSYSDITVTEESGYINAYGQLVPNESWVHSSVDVDGGNTYYIIGTSVSTGYAVMIYDDYHLIKTIPDTLPGSVIGFDGNAKMPANAKRIIINKSASGIAVKRATTILTANSANVLIGKKLYCGGDSITEGANVGTFPNGYKKTYGGYVATRNGMAYVSDGVSGSTMGKCTVNGSVINNFVTSRYLNIPTDADFLTLWFGWNDNAYGYQSARDAYCVTQYGTYYSALTAEQKAEVDAYKTWRDWLTVYAGTKDSSDITTWGGAWNTVLAWILDNCPNAHVGIILAYGTDETLINVLIDICKKYGYGYVSASDVREFFSVGHSAGIGTSQAADRKALYTLDGTHPNELGYSMMSNSYEQFLKRV